MSGAYNLIPFVLAAAAGVVGIGGAMASSCSATPPVSSPDQQDPGKTDSQPAPAAAPSQAKKVGATYADAMRRRQFARAAELIDQAPEGERSKPEVRYARALAALELGDVELSLRIADELEKGSTLFASEAESLRLRAAKLSQDVTLLSHFLGSSRDPADQLLLAEAHVQSSSSREARKIADSVLAELVKSKRDDRVELLARAHMVKARTLMAEDKKLEAAREYYSLATDCAALDEEGEFDAQVTILDPERTLNSTERLARVEAFSRRGLVQQTEREIEALRKIAPTRAASQKVDAMLAWAVYNSRSDYLRAAKLFAKAAGYGGTDRSEYLYYEAKSLARSHRDRDAIAKYEKVAAMGTGYSDHASYQAARLRFIDGQWKASVSAYESYLKKYGRSAKHRTSATNDLPIARLAAKDYDAAFEELSDLLSRESSQRERARLMQLQGVAKLGAEKKEEAAGIFRRVIDYRPLSLPALLAAERLKSMNESVPPMIEPAESLDPRHAAIKPLKLSLPEKSWRLSRVGLDTEAESALQSEEARIRKQFGERSGEALCRLYGQIESARRRYQIAQTAASWSVLSRAPDPLTAWQWDCIYPTPYQGIVKEEATRQKIRPALVYAVMRQESAFRPTVVSPADAVGLMQIIPPTASRIAQSIEVDYEADLMRAPAVNISFGAYYLRYLLDIFGDRPELAAASYNAGPNAVTRWLRAGEDLPLDVFIARIPYQETRNYVYRVMGNYARYTYHHENGSVPHFDLEIPKGLSAPEDAY